MPMNPLVEVTSLGQSIWYDNIRRLLITSGDLKKKIEEDDLRGVTSNPSIFEKAIGGSSDYDDQLAELAGQNSTAVEIYEALAIRDIQMATDLFRPVFDKTGGTDGFVSLECSPPVAHDTQGTIDEARRLRKEVARENVMIKIPATPEGIPAIEQCIYDGININITLIFSQKVYEQVAEAYIRGLERRLAEEKPVTGIASVASFFVSRIDTLANKKLQQRIDASQNQEEKDKLKSLMGRVAIANAKLAYQTFKDIFYGDRFSRLKAAGAQVQRQLWASTSTKDPQYPDVYYVEALIGPDTVDTVPPATFTAFRDHGHPAITIDKDLDQERAVLAALEQGGVSLDQVTTELVDDGVKLFGEAYDQLLKTITERASKKTTCTADRQIESVSQESVLKEGLAELEKRDVVRRIWRKDASLWTNDPGEQKQIAGSLGWLTVVEMMHEHVHELLAFAEEVRSAGFKHIVLLGMGGSSLCPEVLRRSFGTPPDYPELLVLDSTVPAAISSIQNRIDVAKTLFVVSSKSGTTVEPNVFMEYFYDKVKAQVGDGAGKKFVAITDPGTPLEKVARDRGFRRVFLNPPDIGGRYSALSYFGMVPAALAGYDIGELLGRAGHAIQAADRSKKPADNPAARLGAAIGKLATKGLDKLTLIVAPPIDSLGLWIEQLLAESTGKQGKGILPVAGEPLGPPAVYGNDRVFVYVRTRNSGGSEDAKVAALEAAGHPVIRRDLHDAFDLGEEFFTWELATAIAGWFIGINPFDQPNVQESKDNTRRLLEAYEKQGSLAQAEPIARDGEIAVFGDKTILDAGTDPATVVGALLGKVKACDYVALTAYIEDTAEHDGLLEQIRGHIRDLKRVATTVGFGPRFLHSTGQLHKGGPDTGVFIQITADPKEDIPIPGEKYTFGVLVAAEAQGDYESLASRKRRIIRFHVGTDVKAGLERLLEFVRQAGSVGSGTAGK
jgi:transaldolase/glucose-6-phosphate isomerase